MGATSTIEWTQATWNPVRGCSKVSEGCRNCYAMNIAARFSGPGLPYEGLAERHGGKAQWTNRVVTVEDSLTLPLTWKAPRRIFVSSMSDLFHEDVPQEFIYRVSHIMLKTPQHTYQVLTKRPERMAGVWLTSLHCEWLRERLGNHLLTDAVIHHMLRHVWMGTSVEDQAAADIRIPDLLKVLARVRFLSCEPLLGPVDLQSVCPQVGPDDTSSSLDALEGFRFCRSQEDNWGEDIPRVHWVIAGGESGPGARPMHPDWARSLRDQCRAAGVPFFFKQWGEWLPYSQLTHVQQNTYCDNSACVKQVLLTDGVASADVYHVGKKAAGRLLDGETWDEVPQPARPADLIGGGA